MTEQPMSEPGQPAPHTVAPTTAAYDSPAAGGIRWVPLLPARVTAILVVVGVVVGIVGPILLWLNLSAKQSTFTDRVGYLLVLVGLGIVLIGLPLLLVDAARLERVPVGTAAGGPVTERVRGPMGPRIVALVGVVVILAGAYLLREVAPVASGGDSRGQSEGR